MNTVIAQSKSGERAMTLAVGFIYMEICTFHKSGFKRRPVSHQNGLSSDFSKKGGTINKQEAVTTKTFQIQ